MRNVNAILFEFTQQNIYKYSDFLNNIWNCIYIYEYRYGVILNMLTFINRLYNCECDEVIEIHFK